MWVLDLNVSKISAGSALKNTFFLQKLENRFEGGLLSVILWYFGKSWVEESKVKKLKNVSEGPAFSWGVPPQTPPVRNFVFCRKTRARKTAYFWQKCSSVSITGFLWKDPPPSTTFSKIEGGVFSEKFFPFSFLFKNLAPPLAAEFEGGLFRETPW